MKDGEISKRKEKEEREEYLKGKGRDVIRDRGLIRKGNGRDMKNIEAK